jgi:predicted TIM-barrel fold metal-dependent hydrolase
MRYIDAFNHFFPRRFYELMLQSPAGQKDLGKRVRGIPALHDIEERLRVVDSFPDYAQIICLGMPSIDRLTGPEQAPEWARLGNDGLAEIVAKYPDRFLGYAASLPMNAPEAAVKEAERVLANGANAIQLHTNVDGAPIDQDAFLPIYEAIEKSGKPILLHPIQPAKWPITAPRPNRNTKYAASSAGHSRRGRRSHAWSFPASWTSFPSSR